MSTKSVLALLAAVTLTVGCSKKDKEHHAGATPPAPSDPASATDNAAGHDMAGHQMAGHDMGASDPNAHQDHSGKSGGLVQMFGDLHTEVVFDAGGKHSLYLSDATRKPLPPSTVSDVTFTMKRPGAEPEKLVLAPMGDHWMADGKPVDDPKTMVRLDFVYAGKPQFIDVPAVTLAPKAADAQPHAVSHGGTVVKTASGALELVATKDGKFQVFLLDADAKLRPMVGASGSLKLDTKGYQDVALTVVGDHLEGSGAPIGKGHANASVTITADGKTETAAVKLHFEAAGGHHH